MLVAFVSRDPLSVFIGAKAWRLGTPSENMVIHPTT